MKVGFSTYLQELEAQALGAKAAACFDLDRTLIAGYSATALGWERLKSPSVPLRSKLSQLGVALDYGLGRVRYAGLMQVAMRELAGFSEREFLRLGEQAFRRRLAGTLYREGRLLVAAHRRLGHCILMVTSATRAQAAPVARELGIDHLLCSELEVADGRFTGVFTPCHDEGKRIAAQRFCRKQSLNLGEAWFYSDSLDDLPLLEAVGRPVAVNPKAALSALADARGWPRLEFHLRGERAPGKAA